MTTRSNPEVCPWCGAEVPDGAAACPECGSDERTGWAEGAQADALGLPDDSFDYDEFVARELEGRPVARRRGWWWWCVAVVVLGALLWMMYGFRIANW